VRSLYRVAERRQDLENIRWALDGDHREKLAEAIYSYARPDSADELGALKKFRIHLPGGISPKPGTEEFQALARLTTEISVLSKGLPGLPKLLGHSIEEQWIVIELFPDGSLEQQIATRFKGQVNKALAAFRSIVQTVSELHKQGFVHRDIKPANVFVKGDRLILGDFGIAYDPSLADRVTTTTERVGPRDYMPPWADEGERVDDVRPTSDVYMLGKLLWCMLSGKLKLPRENHRRSPFDLSEMFPTEDLRPVSHILDKCVVTHEEECLINATLLLREVDGVLQGSVIKDGKFLLFCVVCKKGQYRELEAKYSLPGEPHGTLLNAYRCDVCKNVQLFAPSSSTSGQIF
jgi:serine/threonine protein kinase